MPYCSTCSSPTATDSRSPRRSRPTAGRRRTHLLARCGGLRSAHRGLRRARLHRASQALSGGVRRPRRLMSSTVATPSRTASVLRDPVLLAPAIVVAGLGIGWLGPDAGVSGARVAADLALAWALVAASLVALERRRWRRTRVLLALAAFTLLAADLQWADAHVLWTLGFLLDAAWVALLVHLVLTFPEGRAWSRTARVAIAAAYLAAFGGQLVGAFVSPDSRDVLSVAQQQTVADAVDRAQASSASPSRSACCGCSCAGCASCGARATRAGAAVPRRGSRNASARPLAGLDERDRRGLGDDRGDRSLARAARSSRPSSRDCRGRACVDPRRPTSSSSCGRTARRAFASASPRSSATRPSTSPIAWRWPLRGRRGPAAGASRGRGEGDHARDGAGRGGCRARARSGVAG